jgi:hypothetical protein
MADGETWQEREAREKREAEEGLRTACAVLRRLGVLHVEAKYDGVGDEGWVQEIRFSPEPPPGLPEGLPALIEKYVYTRLPAGWEVESGSNGTMTIYVATGKANLEHHWKEEVEDLEDLEDLYDIEEEGDA